MKWLLTLYIFWSSSVVLLLTSFFIWFWSESSLSKISFCISYRVRICLPCLTSIVSIFSIWGTGRGEIISMDSKDHGCGGVAEDRLCWGDSIWNSKDRGCGGVDRLCWGDSIWSDSIGSGGVLRWGDSISSDGVAEDRLCWGDSRSTSGGVADRLRIFVKSIVASLSITGVTARLDWVDWLRCVDCCVLCCEDDSRTSSSSSSSSSYSSSKEVLERTEIRLLLLKPLTPRVPPTLRAPRFEPLPLPLPLRVVTISTEIFFFLKSIFSAP